MAVRGFLVHVGEGKGGRKWRCIICAYFMWLPLSGALIILITLLITCCKYGEIIQIYSSSSRFSPHKAPHSCLVLPPPPPPLLFLSSLLVTPLLPLSLFGHRRAFLPPTSQTFGCHRRRIPSLCPLVLSFFLLTLFFPELKRHWGRKEQRERERRGGKSGRYGASHNNDPVLTKIEWIKQSILSANEIRDMGRDGVVPFLELLGERFPRQRSSIRGNCVF